MKEICCSFKLNDTEYQTLDKMFGDLCNYEAWQLMSKNKKNNHTSDFEDIVQELKFSLVLAGCYYKRQVYVENSLAVAMKYAKDAFTISVLKELGYLWKNKTKHGANKQTFGPYQENLLDMVVKRVVPEAERPNKNAALRIDKKFETYCKAITWNRQKSLGRQITKEKTIRNGLCSISEFDYIATSE